MKKVLKTMLKVILWLVPCAGTIACFCCAYCTHLGVIGALIAQYGHEYLDANKTGNAHMKHTEFRALDTEAHNKVYEKACKDARDIENIGWKWWFK